MAAKLKTFTGEEARAMRKKLGLNQKEFWFSRSGHGFNHDTRLANCVGVIDSDYRGEVMVKLTADDDAEHRGNLPLYVSPGDRVAQAMLQPVERITFNVAEWLSETERGTGGFGSTGAA